MLHIIDNIPLKHDIWQSEINVDAYVSSNITILKKFFINPKTVKSSKVMK